ncbi:hypothetical protein G9A89_007035 [Geosiphon pyriformis]|nr:hypothetical protein G9A89_007035 [Geosiphon pyriformis]
MDSLKQGNNLVDEDKKLKMEQEINPEPLGFINLVSDEEQVDLLITNESTGKSENTENNEFLPNYDSISVKDSQKSCRRVVKGGLIPYEDENDSDYIPNHFEEETTEEERERDPEYLEDIKIRESPILDQDLFTNCPVLKTDSLSDHFVAKTLTSGGRSRKYRKKSSQISCIEGGKVAKPRPRDRKSGFWTPEQDRQLIEAIEKHGCRWSLVATECGGNRNPFCYHSHWNVLKKRILN